MKNFVTHLGGSSANIGVQLALFGGDCTLLTRVSDAAQITLQNPSIGDHLNFVSDGTRWYVSGMTNDTVALSGSGL